MERCFRNQKSKDRESLVNHTLVYVHRTGRIEIEVILKDGEHSSAVAAEEEESLLNSANLAPIYTSSYCNICENWVTPYEPISDEVNYLAHL